MCGEAVVEPNSDQLSDEPPEIPLLIDVMGGIALVAALSSELVSKPSAKRWLRGVAAITGLPFMCKMSEYNSHFKTDLFGRNFDWEKS